MKFCPVKYDKRGRPRKRKKKKKVEEVKESSKTYQQQICIRYGLAWQRFLEMQERGKGLCAICKKKKTLFIDHDEKTDKIRGLLCRSCNFGLGSFLDNLDSLEEAIHYLTFPLFYEKYRYAEEEREALDPWEI